MKKNLLSNKELQLITGGSCKCWCFGYGPDIVLNSKFAIRRLQYNDIEMLTTPEICSMQCQERYPEYVGGYRCQQYSMSGQGELETSFSVVEEDLLSYEASSSITY